MEGLSISIECPLCTITEREQTIYSDKLIYLVKTKDDKGHKKRIMVCTHRHTEVPTFEEEIHAICLLFSYMSRIMGERTWYIVDDSYASIPEHYHRIACDSIGNEDELEQLSKTTKATFPLEI